MLQWTLIIIGCTSIATMSFEIPIPATFGNVAFSGNSNYKVSGVSNEGLVSSNSNLALSATNCKLNLSQNSNAKLNTEDSSVNSSSCSNLSLSGKGNTAVLNGNSNSKFSGDGNSWEGSSNSNVKVEGTGSRVKLVENANAHISGDKNEVSAERNANLKVAGGGNHQIVIKNTFNHFLERVSQSKNDGERTNTVEIKPGFGASCNGNMVQQTQQSFISSMTMGLFGRTMSSISSSSSSSSSSHPQFEISYVDRADIDGGRYSLGSFNFKIEEKSPTLYQVIVDDSGFDPGTFVSRKVSSSEIVLCGVVQQGGAKECLKLKAPVIKEGASGKAFDIELISQSNM